MNTINWWISLKSEISRHPIVYFFLVVILLAAFFVRVYRLDQLLGFYYDQGRDALVIWQFWHEGKLFLIGPTTGIEGIFRGPWYYWLIAPFYLLGAGNPVWPSVFLALISVLAVGLLFYLTSKVAGRLAGFIAVILASFSYYLVVASRWLSNPTPMLLISMLLILFMFLVLEGKKWAWIGIALMLGMAMQFGSAAEVFYFPAVAVFALWQRKNLPSKKILTLSFLVLLVPFLPQIIFDLKHGGILRTAIKQFLLEEESFRTSFWDVVQNRINLYQSVFLSKLFPTDPLARKLSLILIFLALAVGVNSIWGNKYFRTVLLVLTAPLLGMLFFQGNYGNIYDYYFTGYYLVFVLAFSSLLALLARYPKGLVVIFVFLFLFFQDNLPLVRNYLVAGVDGETHISLGNQTQAVNWVLENAAGRDFNADVYVPPVIPHAYDYLFSWETTRRCGEGRCGMQLDQQVPLLYTLYEVDPPHPERLEAWLDRQKGIGVVEETVRFGGITVERRLRIE